MPLIIDPHSAELVIIDKEWRNQFTKPKQKARRGKVLKNKILTRDEKLKRIGFLKSKYCKTIIHSRSIKIKLQGFYFYPCRQSYWIHWGRYLFDIRDVREYLGTTRETCIDLERDSQKSFESKMKSIIELTGERDFMDILYESQKPKSTLDGINDDLPF